MVGVLNFPYPLRNLLNCYPHLGPFRPFRPEGKEKAKGVVVRRGLKEGQSESAGRCTRIGYEVWYTQDELARDNEVLHPRVAPGRGVACRPGRN